MREPFLTPHYLALVTSFVEGETLEAFLDHAGAAGRITESGARFIFQQLALAVR
jgi:hypothetical protein